MPRHRACSNTKAFYALWHFIVTPMQSARKRWPALKLLLQLERISALPKAQQRFVMQMFDTVLQQRGG